MRIEKGGVSLELEEDRDDAGRPLVGVYLEEDRDRSEFGDRALAIRLTPDEAEGLAEEIMVLVRRARQGK
jgi:hypothetical protein